MKTINPHIYKGKYPRTKARKKTLFWQVQCYLPGAAKPYQKKHPSLMEAERDRVRLILEYGGAGQTSDQARDSELAQRRLDTCQGDAKGRTILEAIEFFISNFEDHSKTPLVSFCIAAFTKTHVTGKRAGTVEEYERYLPRLGARFGNLRIADLSREALTEFVATYPSPGPHRKCLVAFFGYCSGTSLKLPNPTPWVKENEARWIPVPAKGADKEIVIFTVEQVKSLLSLALFVGDLPYWIWCLYTGMRPDEARKFWTLPGYGWDRVNLDGNYIVVNSEIAKDKSRRKIVIRPNLKQWLILFKQSETRMYPSGHRLKFREIKGALLTPEICRVRDLLRHTFVSFRAAAFDKSLAATAAESGNSEAIIKAHYFEVIADQAAIDEFWNLTPSSFGLPEADEVPTGEMLNFELEEGTA